MQVLSGTPSTLCHLHPGSYFGEIALMDLTVRRRAYQDRNRLCLPIVCTSSAYANEMISDVLESSFKRCSKYTTFKR